jgi:hypothetical protein
MAIRLTIAWILHFNILNLQFAIRPKAESSLRWLVPAWGSIFGVPCSIFYFT